ncbi:porin [Pseudorhodobacter sp.]|uniref:porin n=1 Tax=Pseudorhodobacter sp. TaxID=1934400 RepID=UPI0026482757|nr:porin [Pseudorhodobacter sp.]MDN5787734.1 porin [Pseudorhodobacter sp.]
MKKILIATTALVATAGVAAADVTLSGIGRFGLKYDNSAAVGASKTQLAYRLRFNIDASKETDSGVTFGGRIRMQSDYNSNGQTARLNAANVYASYNGLKVTVGNVGGAYDDAALIYNSELSFDGTSFGDPGGNFYSYKTGAYAAAEANRMGVNVAYSMAGINLEASYINPDQSVKTLPAAQSSEFALAASYKYNQFTISAATAQNGGGVKNNDLYFLGAEYAVNDLANVGLLYMDNGDKTIDGRTITLYGNYKMDAITLRGYVANNNAAGNATNTAFGIGADYDLGGATLAGGVERGYAKETVASLGVKFSF